MYSNQASIEKIQFVEKSEELKKLKAMLVSAMVSYPLWGLFSKYMAPLAYDPIWQRLALSFFAGLVLIATPFQKKTYNNIAIYCFVAWLYSYHLLFLYWKNADTVYYMICNLIQFSYVVLAFPTKKTAQIYTYTKMGAAILFAFLVSYKALNPWFYVLSIITIGQYMITILTQHFNVLGSLKSAQREFDLAISNMLEGVIMMDNHGVLTAYNNTAESLLNFKGKSHIGKSYKETCLYKDSFKENLKLYTDDDHPFVKSIIQNQAIRNTVIGVIPANGEKLWLQLNIQPISINNSANNILVSFSDLTNIKINQEIKDKEQAQMAMNARLSSMFAVAGGIAHEINNPLGIIIARLQNLEKKIELDQFDKDFFINSIQKTIATTYRIAKVISSLLTLSKRTSEFPMVAVSLSEILGDTLRLCQENLKHQEIKLIVDEIPDAQIKCRAVQISQVILNLINNAIDAVEGQKEKWIHFSFKETNNEVFISVCDSGPSIPNDIKERMMDPFFTTKEVGKGAGLGLSVSKGIIEEHGGLLYLDKSTPGTCLVIQLKKELLNFVI